MRRRVVAYVDGHPASAEDMAAVEAHLRDCPDCADDVVLLHRVKRSLRRWAERQPPELTGVRLRRWMSQHLR